MKQETLTVRSGIPVVHGGEDVNRHGPTCPTALGAYGGDHGPCLCLRRSPGTSHDPGPCHTPPRAPGEVTEATAALASSDPQRRAAVRAARARLADAGKTWADARAWAAADGRWMPSDLHAINPYVVDCYLGSLSVQASR
jgi:hypothetical protein